MLSETYFVIPRSSLTICVSTKLKGEFDFSRKKSFLYKHTHFQNTARVMFWLYYC